ncbi:MAG: phenylacetate--CoA ligase family protein [Candidatus Hodarchaeota archaeon]
MFNNSWLSFPHIIKSLLKNTWYRIVPFPYVFRFEFAKYYKFLMQSQWWSQEKLEEFQNKRLQIVIKHAYENVPYYRKIFNDRGLSPNDIKSKEDLKILPVLTKNDVRENFNNLLAKNFIKFKPSCFHTSGSTGEPLHYYIDKTLIAFTQAIVWRHWQWCGVKYGEPIAIFRGTLIDDFGKKQKNHWKIEGNQVHFSTFEMSEKIMARYVEKLNEIRPTLIRGYPASLEIFAKFIKSRNLNIPSPTAIQTASETVLPEQRRIIEQVFNSKLFDLYGHGESTVYAGECQHNGMHLDLEYGYSEFIKTDETREMNNVYNVISTSLWNFSMPFIRYDTEDLVLLKNSKCICGRGLPVITKVIGRQADIIEGINGVKVSPSSFVHFWKYRIDNKLSGIKYAQLIQIKQDSLLIKLVGSKDKNNENVIREQINMLLGEMNIEYKYLSQIPTGQKWRFTVSKIKLDK